MDDVSQTSNEVTNFVTLSFMKLLYLQLEEDIKTDNSFTYKEKSSQNLSI